MMLTLTLAAGLLAAPEPQAEPQKGWVVELRGYTYHRQAKPQEWIVELQGFTKHRGQAERPKGWIIDWLFPQAKVQIEPVEGFYVDDLPAFVKQLKKR